MIRYILALSFCVIALPVLALSQGEPGWNKHSIGANFEVSLPMGDFGDIAGTGYGGNVRYQFGYDRRSALTVMAGYLSWTEKEASQVTTVQPAAFSLFIGGKYYVTEGLFASLEGGLYFVDYTYSGTIANAEGNTTRFMLPIGIGFQKSGFEASVRYMLLDVNFNAFSFTVGYNFML